MQVIPTLFDFSVFRSIVNITYRVTMFYVVFYKINRSTKFKKTWLKRKFN